jgi:hypothetical protein
MISRRIRNVSRRGFLRMLFFIILSIRSNAFFMGVTGRLLYGFISMIWGTPIRRLYGFILKNRLMGKRRLYGVMRICRIDFIKSYTDVLSIYVGAGVWDRVVYQWYQVFTAFYVIRVVGSKFAIRRLDAFTLFKVLCAVDACYKRVSAIPSFFNMRYIMVFMVCMKLGC